MGQGMGEQMRYISLFSGVEACSVAWYHMENWQAQAFAEFDAFPSAVLKHQFPHVPNVGDVTKHEWKQYKGKCELIVGGSPCQSFSVAGKRLGLDDPRGNLALHFLRIIEEVQPTWFIFENVAGLLSSDNGRDFAAFLREVENIGYGCAYRIFDAQYFGVPQRRRRVFVVGHIDGDWRRAAAVLFEPKGLSGNPPTRPTQRKEATTNARSSAAESSRRRGMNTILDPQPAGALTTEIYHRGGYGNQTIDTHAALVPEVADTVAAKWMKGADVQLGSQNGGNIIPVVSGFQSIGVDLFNQEETGDVHCALRTAQGHGAPAVMFENHAADSRIKEVDVAPTMTAKYGTGGGNVPLVAQKENICFDHTFGQNAVVYEGVSPTLKANGLVPTSPAVAQEAIPIHDQATRWSGLNGDKSIGKGNGLGVGNEGDPANTLTKNDRHAVAHSAGLVSKGNGEAWEIDERHMALTKGGGQLGQGTPAVRQDLLVRRLTPVECERLQGFPDNWTQIPWKGKPKEKCPDSHRFKAMGNSMAVPVMRWIGEGIELVNRIPREGEVPQQQELGWL